MTVARPGHNETIAGKLLADTAKECGVSHFVWSTLPNSDLLSGGKISTPEMVEKALVDTHILSLGFPYTTFVLYANYFENFTGISKPTRAGDVIVFPYPEAPPPFSVID